MNKGGTGSSRDDELVAKRLRLSEINARADEPVQSWLNRLPRDDLQHVVLLLYARLPTIFGVQKTDTALVVGKILHKNEHTIRSLILCQMTENTQTHSKVTTFATTH